MQEITKDKCSSSSIKAGTEGRLKDSRDNKIYWVAKLKDGLCWMTQNLDYDGGGTQTTNFYNNSASAQYYNPGFFIYTRPTISTTCSSIRIDNGQGLSDCSSYGWKNFDASLLTLAEINPTWIITDQPNFYASVSYVAADGVTICTKQANSYLGDMSSSYVPCRMYNPRYYTDGINELHYSIGNYYNWQSATNGTGSSATTDGATASGSICPTGWSLPLGKNITTVGSFNKLLSGLSGLTTAAAPYYYLAGGSITGSTLNSAGFSGSFWSATSYSSATYADTYAYGFGMTTTNNTVNTTGYLIRSEPRSVRCVAR